METMRSGLDAEDDTVFSGTHAKRSTARKRFLIPLAVRAAPFALLLRIS
jgi:hypothetical protein